MPFALYLLALAVFVMGTSEFILAGLLPALAADLNVTIGAAGLLTSAFAAGMIVGAPLMAAFARRWPPRRMLLICLIVFAGCHVIGAITPNFTVLFAVRVLSAVANAGFLAIALSTATTLVPTNRKGRALAILLSGTTIATVVGVPAGALLGTGMGWRTTFWAIALLCLPAAMGVVRGISKEPFRPTHETTGPDLKAELSELRSPRLILVMALGALINGGTFAALTFLAPLVTEVSGLSDNWISVALVLFGFGSFLGVTAAGRLADQRPGSVLAVGGPLLLLGWVAVASFASDPRLLLALVLVQGALSFGVGSTLITRVLYVASGAPTMGGSYATVALNVGAAAGPVLGALGLAASPSLTAPLWIAAVLTCAALIVLVLTRNLFTARSKVTLR